MALLLRRLYRKMNYRIHKGISIKGNHNSDTHRQHGIANVVVTVLLSIKTKESPVLEGVKCYFTFGICGVILAKKSLKKCKTNTLPQENMALTAQLQAIEQQLNASRHSLSEINHKIEMCKSK